MLPPPPPPVATAPRTSRQRAPWSVVLVALGVALVSLAVATAALLVGDPAVERVDAVRVSALDAARERAEAVTTYDHRTLDADFAQVLETATGEFEKEYRETTEQLRPTFVQSRAIAEGTVVAAGLESAVVAGEEPDRAVAVLAVDQVITTAGAPPRTERNRIRMTLVRPADRWLVESVERL